MPRNFDEEIAEVTRRLQAGEITGRDVLPLLRDIRKALRDEDKRLKLEEAQLKRELRIKAIKRNPKLADHWPDLAQEIGIRFPTRG